MHWRSWNLSPALLLGLVGCQVPGPADPGAGGDGVDPWAGTSWPVLFQEARDLGGRAMIRPSTADHEFEILPIDSRPRAVLADPACNLPGDPEADEARAFRNCMNELARQDDTSDKLFDSRYGFRIRPNRVLTWDEDAGAWRVWNRVTFGCAEGYDEARRDKVALER